MPSVSLQVDRDETAVPGPQQPRKSVNGLLNGKRDGEVLSTNGHVGVQHNEDAFQHLPKPQQEVLMLHGPRQKYTLQRNAQIPELRSEREILIQVRQRILVINALLITIGPYHWTESSRLERPVCRIVTRLLLARRFIH